MQILFRITMPLATPVLATIALWTMVTHWNAWFDSYIYVATNSKRVLQMMLRKILMQEYAALAAIRGEGQYLKNLEPMPIESVKAAMVIVTIGPIILAYPFLQRYFIKGIFIGSLKG